MLRVKSRGDDLLPAEAGFESGDGWLDAGLTASSTRHLVGKGAV
jgi:hypothetical protein